jgi:hypothetical protein
MSMTRKRFCGAVAGGTVLLLFSGCGGGSDAGTGGTGDPTGCGADGNEIADNHGHALAIPAADLDSMVARTYSIHGSADHDHTVTFTPAMLQQLKGGQAVGVTSTAAASAYVALHTHEVVARC